jgi:ubiquinone/menaquinone biosynthesis C-methylase UbiE
VFPIPYVNTFLRSQFGKPSGWFGSTLMVPLLNIANRRVMRVTIDLLEAKPTDTVLDIGFGGGYSLTRLAEKVTRGKVTGVDYSREMVDSAAVLVRARHLQSRIRVRQGDVARLPFHARTFDKVVTVNSIYFWPDPDAGFREIARVLKPSGQVAVGFRSPVSLRLLTIGWKDFSLHEPREVAEMMKQAGLRVKKVVYRDRWQLLDTVVIIASRSIEPRA